MSKEPICTTIEYPATACMLVKEINDFIKCSCREYREAHDLGEQEALAVADTATPYEESGEVEMGKPTTIKLISIKTLYNTDPIVQYRLQAM